jgi:hypothetical protein
MLLLLLLLGLLSLQGLRHSLQHSSRAWVRLRRSLDGTRQVLLLLLSEWLL